MSAIKVDGQKIISVGNAYDIKITSWPTIDGEKVHKSKCYWDGKKVQLKIKEVLISEESKIDIAETDNDLIRVIDDLINFILYKTPIPDAAIEKIKNRKALRDKIK